MSTTNLASDQSRRCIFVIGGTGIGKTKLGVELSLALNGEVVNSDAMQLYKAIPIATAQPNMDERRGVPHHLLGVLDPQQNWTVRDYRDNALAVMKDIWSRGKIPIVVGGTLYYSQALIWRSLLDDQPGFEEDDDSKRPKLMSSSTGAASLTSPSGIQAIESPFDTLKRLDPKRAAQLHPKDERRVARALEIVLTTGKSSVEAKEDPSDVRLDCRIIWLSCEDQVELERRLRARIQAMMSQGLVEEAEAFISQHPWTRGDIGKGVFQAIGFRELEPLISDRHNAQKHDECVEALVIKHRQYVKSQLKWIKNRILTRSVPVNKLDATDLTKWMDNVQKPALAIAAAFLVERKSTQEINSNHPVANKVDSPLRDTKTARNCDVCGGKTLMGNEQWEKHVRGRSHRRAVEVARKNAVGPESPKSAVLAEEAIEENGTHQVRLAILDHVLRQAQNAINAELAGVAPTKRNRPF